jgi:hypothetical protein
VLYLLNIRASHNFITQENAERMEFQLEKLKAPIEVHIASKKHASSTRELERKGGFVGFHLRGNGMHFGNGIHHPKQCAHRRAQ